MMRDPTELSNRDPGEDPDDPYEDINVCDLPEWWRQAIEEFRKYGLRPYRPPRFLDGTNSVKMIKTLEDDLGVTIEFRCINSDSYTEWELFIEDKVVATIDRHRSTEGYTVYEVTKDEFEDIVRSAVST